METVGYAEGELELHARYAPKRYKACFLEKGGFILENTSTLKPGEGP